MIHDIDIVLHLVRQRECTIDAVGVAVLGPCEDVANARIHFADQAVANLTASRLALKTERKIRVFGPSAYLSMDYQKKSGVAIKLADNLDLIRMAKERNFEDLSQMQALDFGSMLKIEPLAVDNVEPLRAEIESFLDSVRTGRGGGVSAEEGYAAVELAERITKAVRDQDWGRGLANVTQDSKGGPVRPS
jgi:predicted dehydrogenase